MLETVPLWRRALGEAVGTAGLVAVVIGSGIAAQRLSPDDVGLQLMENAWATALGLAVLIVVLAPVSGAHFNPVVTLTDRLLAGVRSGREITALVLAQVGGAVAGAVIANAMFDVPTALSTTDRATAPGLFAEVVATAGLVMVIHALVRSGRGPTVIGPAVGAYIGAAYWFTSSTSFANPAVTVGRVWSDTFAGIAPTSVLPFIAAQLVGAALGAALAAALMPAARAAREAEPVSP